VRRSYDDNKSLKFYNIDKFKVSSTPHGSYIIHNTKNLIITPIMSNIRIESGIHTIRLRSVNDSGGDVVIGISDKLSYDYHDCIGCSGNGFSVKYDE